MMEDFDQISRDLFILGNHHHYGLNTDSYERRGNELLSLQDLTKKEWLAKNRDSDRDRGRDRMKCHQFWLVGFLSGQKLKIEEENFIGFEP